MEQERLFSLLAKSLTYAGVVYGQAYGYVDPNGNENVFALEYKHTDIPEDSLLFFVPTKSSKDKTGNPCILRIRTPSRNQSGQIVYLNNDFDIVTETTESSYKAADLGDIIANRLCIFRFDFPRKRAILVNSPLYNSVAVSDLSATNATFSNRPKVKAKGSADTVELATMADISALEERLSKWESKILFGTQDWEDVMPAVPDGTIYIQVSEEE